MHITCCQRNIGVLLAVTDSKLTKFAHNRPLYSPKRRFGGPVKLIALMIIQMLLKIPGID